MNTQEQNRFNSLYQQYINELTLQGKQPRTIEGYSLALRQAATYFDRCPDQLTLSQLKAFFHISSIRVPGARSRLPAMPCSSFMRWCYTGNGPGSISLNRPKSSRCRMSLPSVRSPV